MSKPYTVAEVIDALRESHGLLSLAAELLGCHRKTVYNFVQRYPSVAEVVAEEREGLADLAEKGLRYHLEERSPWAIAFTLRTLAKSRGYQEKGADPDPRDMSEVLESSPEWQQLQSTLLATLQAYPEARWAVARALNGNGHESTNGHTPGA